MAALFKIQIQDLKPLARLYFNNSCSHPSWIAEYRLKGRPRKLALCAWDPNDVEYALAEAAEFLGCPPDRIKVDSQ
jgi:hypothetical protein